MNDSVGLWGDKRFCSLDFALKERFGRKVAKIAVDAGFTCPTRDGVKGTRGCLFCSSRGSGDFTKPGSILEQMEKQATLARAKWGECLFIPYFQSFTNTYASVEAVRQRLNEALSFPGVAGVALATRCDCLEEPMLDLLEEYHTKTFLWIELGLQTAKDETGRLIRRGFETRDFTEAVIRLSKRGIFSVAHLIAGLPGEGREDFLDTVRLVARLPLWGVKLQMLHVLRDSDLYESFQNEPYRLFEREEYVELVCDALELLPPNRVIHRLTGDGKRANLYAPLWTLDKRRVLTEINQELARRKSCQGKFYSV